MPIKQIKIFYQVRVDSLMYLMHGQRGPGSSVGIATGYGLDGRGSNPGEGEIFRTRPGGRGVVLTFHPLLAPRSRKDRAIPPSTLWANQGQTERAVAVWEEEEDGRSAEHHEYFVIVFLALQPSAGYGILVLEVS
jgi:hypothetical protein